MTLRTLIGVAATALAATAYGQITFYEGPEFHGRGFTANGPIDNFSDTGFNDRATSVVVDRGRWEVCEHAHFQGHCVVLQRGQYPSLSQLGMNNMISSVRPVYRETAYNEPPPARVYNQSAPAYDYRAQPGERIYQANVVAVHAVVGPPEQRCWVERQQVEEHRGGPNVPGAIIGGVIGGVLGHQVGGGRGRDVATAGGAVAGAAIGANAGRGETTYSTQDVQRCREVRAGMRPEFWDVTYVFNGQEHHVQLSAPPGPTIAVNEYGEPRIG
jgi:uncharacterized protein YcfJ